VCSDVARRPKTDLNPALLTTPFTIYLQLLTSKGALETIHPNRFVEPEVQTSIEHPYPDRVPPQTRAASFKRPYLK
jgi:hypothetical protein